MKIENVIKHNATVKRIFNFPRKHGNIAIKSCCYSIEIASCRTTYKKILNT